MTDRPPALSDDLVHRLRSFVTGGPAPATKRAARVLARPLRRAIVRLVDPSLRAALDQVRHETAAREAAPAVPALAEVEVLRAELRSTHAAIEDLSRRLASVEKTLSDL
jgi:hypothetical protein